MPIKQQKVKIPKPHNRAEETLALQLRLAKVPFEREYRFAPPRKFRADFALLEHKILVEVEGGAFLPGGGRHNRAKGFVNDMVKYRLAAHKGYLLLRFPPSDVIKGTAIREIADLIVSRWIK